MAGKYAFIEAELARRRREKLLRRLRAVEPLCGVEVRVDGRPLVNFSSNDYLGLAFHPQVCRRAAQFLRLYGAGATAARLVCGAHPGFALVEEKLARLMGRERVLVFTSGFQANSTLLPALADRHSLILVDRLGHRSLIQGALAAGCPVRRFRHNDLEHLRQLLAEGRGQHERLLIATESVFGMDGDQSDVPALSRLATEFQALLLVDEAHATGVLGPGGMGLCCGQEVDLVVGTFGKACGSFGAYVACAEPMAEYLVNCCAGFVYTTALPPAVLGAVDAALELIPRMEEERRALLQKAEFLRQSLRQLGWDTAGSTTQIVPLVTGDTAEALALAGWLEEQGVLAAAIRPPTAAQARLRFSLSALHTGEHLESLVGLLRRWREQRG